MRKLTAPKRRKLNAAISGYLDVAELIGFTDDEMLAALEYHLIKRGGLTTAQQIERVSDEDDTDWSPAQELEELKESAADSPTDALDVRFELIERVGRAMDPDIDKPIQT